MVDLLDKRYAKRHGCDGEIVWSYFNKKAYYPCMPQPETRGERRSGQKGPFMDGN